MQSHKLICPYESRFLSEKTNTQVAYSTQTSKTVPQTLEALTEALKQRSFGDLKELPQNVERHLKEAIDAAA